MFLSKYSKRASISILCLPQIKQKSALNICIYVTQTGIQITSLKYFFKAVKDAEVQMVWIQVKNMTACHEAE